jgi:preprotein translocase subunit SecE
MSLVSYVKESYNELVHKVSWTPVKELQSLAITVMVASLIFALVIMAMDLSFEFVMKEVYKLLALR